jgi:hypothetical protein
VIQRKLCRQNIWPNIWPNVIGRMYSAECYRPNVIGHMLSVECYRPNVIGRMLSAECYRLNIWPKQTFSMGCRKREILLFSNSFFKNCYFLDFSKRNYWNKKPYNCKNLFPEEFHWCCQKSHHLWLERLYVLHTLGVAYLDVSIVDAEYFFSAEYSSIIICWIFVKVRNKKNRFLLIT